MWCRHCQQDVPAVARRAEGRVQCARCQRPLASPAFAAPVNDAGVRIDGGEKPQEPVAVEPWTTRELIGPEDQQRLRQIGRQLRTGRGHAVGAQPGRQRLRFDNPGAASSSQPTPASPTQRPVVHNPMPAPMAPSKSSQATAWVAALLGAMTLGAGIGLLGWSLLGERPDLWSWGLGATLTGQGLMIVGLVQLLASLWTAGRDATGRLITLHYEIRRLQRTADSLAGMRTATPTAFYADLSRGSSPQVLLSNLKGQIDDLTTRLAGE